MPFNPGSFTGTQNAGIKPKIIVGSQGYMDTGASGWSGIGYGATVSEGKSAFVSYHFTDPSNSSSLVELMDSATLNIQWNGASSADVTGGLQYQLFYNNGWTGTWNNVVNGQVSLGDTDPTDPTVGTKVKAIAFRIAVATDAVAENGEHILFQLTQSSATKFTDSFYIEAKLDIVDSVSTPTFANGFATGTLQQDVFDLTTVTSTVWAGTSNFQTINAFDRNADKLKVDIAPTGGSTPNLSMVNFGVLTNVGIGNEGQLINGMRALNGLDCNQGGLYIMGVGADTYIIFDSTNDGRLDTDGTGTDDVFVKLAGINPHSLQSTNFDLV